MSEDQTTDLTCPFCGEGDDFDKPGLKTHLMYRCSVYVDTEDFGPSLFAGIDLGKGSDRTVQTLVKVEAEAEPELMTCPKCRGTKELYNANRPLQVSPWSDCPRCQGTGKVPVEKSGDDDK